MSKDLKQFLTKYKKILNRKNEELIYQQIKNKEIILPPSINVKQDEKTTALSKLKSELDDPSVKHF